MADLEDALSPDVGERRRRPGGAPRRRPPRADVRHPGGQGVPPQRRDRDAARPAARLAPRRAPRLVDGGPISASPVRLRAVLLPQRAPSWSSAARARTSTCPSSRAISRRGSGTTSSSTPRTTLGIPRGTIRATVLIETILAAFEMDEILYELREHAAGLNAGRWDYLFSCIKKFRGPLGPGPAGSGPADDDARRSCGPTRSCSSRTCHRRGAHAIGGMAAFIPSRRDAEVNATAMAKVRDDKERESGDGFDGTWVAHPDLVPLATEIFDGVLGDRPNQKDRLRDDVVVTAADLLDLARRRRHDDRGRRPANVSRRAAVPRRVAGRQRRRRDQQPHGGRGDGRDLAARSSGSGGRPARRSTTAATVDRPTATARSATRSWRALGGRDGRRRPPRRRRDAPRRLVLDDEFAEFLTLRAYSLLD